MADVATIKSVFTFTLDSIVDDKPLMEMLDEALKNMRWVHQCSSCSNSVVTHYPYTLRCKCGTYMGFVRREYYGQQTFQFRES